MSKGGKYIIQQNEDGRIQDAITLNLPLLEDRLKEIREKECRDPLKPRILIDIAQTHNVFIKRYYKPTFPVAYEWTAEPLDSGTIFGFNTTNRFLLPVYGDFIGEMILYVKFSGLSAVSPLDKCYYCDFPGHRIAQTSSGLGEFEIGPYIRGADVPPKADNRLDWRSHPALGPG